MLKKLFIEKDYRTWGAAAVISDEDGNILSKRDWGNNIDPKKFGNPADVQAAVNKRSGLGLGVSRELEGEFEVLPN